MNFSFRSLKNELSQSILVLFLILSIIQVQSQNICNDGDCSSEVFTIKLDSPLQLDDPTTSGTQRTEEYKAAYLKIKSIKAAHAQTQGWNKRYKDWDLGGGNCIRLYQLESLIGYEYERNAEFKKFIEANEPNIEVFRRNGFESSRRAINLLLRMKSQCKRQVKKLEAKDGPPLEELPPTYRKLGEKLGFFDKEGNLVLPPDNPKADKEKQTAELKEKLEAIPAGSEQKDRLSKIGNGLKSASKILNVLNDAKPIILETLESLLPGPVKILLRIGKIGKVQDALKSIFQKKNDEGLLGKINNLISKGKKIKDAVDQIADKPQKLKDQFDKLATNIDDLKENLDQQNANIGDLDNTLASLIKKKEELKSKLDQPIESLSDVSNLIENLAKESDDLSKKIDDQEGNKDRLLDKLADLTKKQEIFLPELKALKDQLNDFNKQTDELEGDTEQVEEAERELALQEQVESIKKEYGTDVKLKPVTTEEWAESFEVKRPYWDAVFHPDNEVVKGFKGRYFEIRLKDAEKNVKLLFGPGEYFIEKNDFRNNYGTTIGTFVAEALSHTKKVDASKVILFIQGSADNAGHNTFRGNLDERYMYTEVNVLPQNDDQETFGNTASSKKIPEKSFDNNHLPDLRGNYLKEMIKVYSKKLDPILLEGQVKKVVEEGERNAVIYLFIPEELLAEDE